MSKLRDSLKADGPQTLAELGYQPSYEDRQNGVRRFNLRGGTGSTASGLGKAKGVYYLDTHAPETVVRKWLEINNGFADNVSNWTIHKRICQYGDEWKEASRDLFGPFDTGGRGKPTGGECAICGEEYSRYLRDHLAECEKA